MDAQQKEALEQQMAQCPFCQIAAKKIPATIIYEDAKVMVISDINPLSPGHCILFPKDHVPILQMLAKEQFSSLCEKIPSITRAIKKGAVCSSLTLFNASGGHAGQQMPHVLMHLIPRNNGDGIKNFDKPVISLNDEQILVQFNQIIPILKKNSQLMLEKDAIRSKNAESSPPFPSFSPSPFPSSPSPDSSPKLSSSNSGNVSDEQKKLIAQFLESDEDMFSLLLSHPDKFAEVIFEKPQLKNIFAGIDLHILSKKLKDAQANE